MRQFNKFAGTRGFISTWERVIRFKYMITEKAQNKVRILAFWEKHGLQAAKDAFKVSRATLYRWAKALKYKNVLAVNSKDRTVLDVACGDDDTIVKLASQSELAVANDISRKSMFGLIKSSAGLDNILFLNQNLLELKFKIKFDTVISKNTIHHMKNSEELELMLGTLKNLGRRLIIMDIEDPKLHFLSYLWNRYYVFLLKDQGGFFLNYKQFCDILKLTYKDSKNIEFRKVKTIKGTYMLAVVDQ